MQYHLENLCQQHLEEQSLKKEEENIIEYYQTRNNLHTVYISVISLNLTFPKRQVFP